ncbi:preprotein translocase subunit SecG [Paracoccus aminophilus]|uniref:Protein-export membrane protein SecG n=1 Tax=Paracoccus aminophilus JCM 7686 TaxID=1367847 RepID=S5YD79_PARAH|nr:preprotein translocase subunit SecG [Paracoccus aminophilus]AGT09413.1 preprotein translocase subunit SecG [Paracoccus aminophilus JCM 7686]
MENVVLTVHLILAVALIALVLLQRSEGGGLGMGGGGGGGVMTGRQAANALTRITWILAIAFLVTSVTLTIMAARGTAGSSVADQLDLSKPTMPAPSSSLPAAPSYAPPPSAGLPVTPPTAAAPAANNTSGAEPVVTPPAETPAAPAPAEPATPAPATPAPASN